MLAVATGVGSVMDKTRALIGEDNLAMLIAKSALAGTSQELSPTVASEVLKISRTTAMDRIDRASVKDCLIKS